MITFQKLNFKVNRKEIGELKIFPIEKEKTIDQKKSK